jgi:hypothetical protein
MQPKVEEVKPSLLKSNEKKDKEPLIENINIGSTAMSNAILHGPLEVKIFSLEAAVKNLGFKVDNSLN